MVADDSRDALYRKTAGRRAGQIFHTILRHPHNYGLPKVEKLWSECCILVPLRQYIWQEIFYSLVGKQRLEVREVKN
jgi:hypothetical protein